MDNSIRKHARCVINLPSCDYVFSSTRSCFIAYGFHRSVFEMQILQSILKDRGIETHEAGALSTPGQYAFCTKICSKIITSQFCIVLLNNDNQAGIEVPNANVNMEYGLMLGFNKYVIPFQVSASALPFNVAGLDTIKYENSDFKVKAERAIDQAIAETRQDSGRSVPLEQNLGGYLLLRGAIVCPIDSPGEKAIYQLGAVCGFNLCIDYEGNGYIYFGNFATLRGDVISWRVNKLNEILTARVKGMEYRETIGFTSESQRQIAAGVVARLKIWLHVANEVDRELIFAQTPTAVHERLSVFTTEEISEALHASGML